MYIEQSNITSISNGKKRLQIFFLQFSNNKTLYSSCLSFQGRTALHVAADHGDYESGVIQMLLENGCKTNEIDNEVKKKWLFIKNAIESLNC